MYVFILFHFSFLLYMFLVLSVTMLMCVCILHVCDRAWSMMCISEGILWSLFCPSTVWMPGFNLVWGMSLKCLYIGSHMSASILPFLKHTLNFYSFISHFIWFFSILSLSCLKNHHHSGVANFLVRVLRNQLLVLLTFS